MTPRRQNFIFILVGFFSVLIGFALTSTFVGKAYSQAPPSEDLPPELGGPAASAPQPTKPASATGVATPVPPTGAVPPPPSNAPIPTTGGLQALPPETTSGGVVELPNNLNPADAGPLDEYVRPQAVDGYTYDPTGKRDPFRPYLSAGKLGIGTANLAVETAPPIELEPLQKFELGTLEVVGIIWDVSRPRALVRDPNRTVYTVKKGQKIGKNEGYVAEIREGEVIVIETYEDQGKLVKDARVMAIKK